MFYRNLSDVLKHTEKKDYYGVLATYVSDQLGELADSAAVDIHATLDDYYKFGSNNYQIIETAAKANADEHPMLFCCYALITDNINQLDIVQLEYTLNWLSNQVENFPEYEHLAKSVEAILAIKEKNFDKATSFPQDCYLNFAGADLHDTDLSGLNLKDANLTNANLKNANLSDCMLADAVLYGANAQGADFTDADMEGAYLSNADLSGANLEYATLINAEMRNIVLNNAQMNDCDLQHADMHQAKLSGASLQRANMYKTNLSSVLATEADLQSAMLDDACLNGSNFENADLHGAIMRGAHLHETNFTKAQLNGATFTSADMKDTTCISASMQNTCLQHVNLDGSFKDADLAGSDLRGAKLCSSNLDLMGANLTDCQLDKATQFFYTRGKSSNTQFAEYVAKKKYMLSHATFLSDAQLQNTKKLDTALIHLYLKLEGNRDFPRLQECIGRDFINHARKLLQENPVLVSNLRDTAYRSPMFQPNIMLFQAVNDVAKAWHELRSEPHEVDAIESAAQEQMRMALPRR